MFMLEKFLSRSLTVLARYQYEFSVLKMFEVIGYSLWLSGASLVQRRSDQLPLFV